MAKRQSRGQRQPRQRTIAPTHFSGNRFAPLSDADMEHIHSATVTLLTHTGFSGGSDALRKRLVQTGASVNANGRLVFSASQINNAINTLAKQVLLAGRQTDYDMHLSDGQVFTGTGGAAPFMIDSQTGHYRPSTLADLKHAATLVNQLDNIHFFSRSVVARDIEDPALLDINTAYTALGSTEKHVMVAASSPNHVQDIATLCFTLAGSRDSFVKRPFLSLNINHCVPPLRLDNEACDVLWEAANLRIPVQVNTFGQLGASSPVTVAGSVAQTMAETLAGMIIAWTANPEAVAICGPRSMVTDLRTGAMAGGSGEQALVTACTTQMSRFYRLPNSTIAGATDSKTADAQSGYEKCLSITLAAHSGANLITQACGMHAGLMACSLESYVIDNDMLGNILRSLAPVEVSPDTLALTDIHEIVNGEGHFLGRSETLNRMQTDFLYPSIANRQDHQTWENAGAQSIKDAAHRRVTEILRDTTVNYIEPSIDRHIRQQHTILPEPS